MNISVRIFFDNADEAIEALIICLEDARVTDRFYTFGSRSYKQVMSSGLMIYGDAEHLVKKLEEIPGSSIHWE